MFAARLIFGSNKSFDRSLKIFCTAVLLLAASFFSNAQHRIIPNPTVFSAIDERANTQQPFSVILNSAEIPDVDVLLHLLNSRTSITFSKSATKVLLFENLNGAKAKEAYALRVTTDSIMVKAASEAGYFYAIQSLLQLFDEAQQAFTGCEIFDEPAYEYRAMHLDVCRHFFGKQAVKQYIELLAALKMNYLHLHLTDDQGWRMEVKKYPLLTEIGAWRTSKDGSRYGGFFTQDDLRELVAFARQRNVTIIPEIEIPGHSSAAIAAYPFLSCHNKPVLVPNSWGIKKDIYCPTDSTIQFLKDVLDEACDIFPSPYIHLGGDEAPKSQWRKSRNVNDLKSDKNLRNYSEVQSWFMRQIEDHLSAKGRRAIGWGEVTKGNISNTMIVMSWLDKTAGYRAAKRGNDVIMAPRFYCYFDYPQSSKDKLHAIWMTPLPLKKVYRFEPIDKKISPKNKVRILGGQACVWTEFIKTEQQLLHQVMPRLAAMSEALWSSKKDFNDFERRLKQMK